MRAGQDARIAPRGAPGRRSAREQRREPAGAVERDQVVVAADVTARRCRSAARCAGRSCPSSPRAARARGRRGPSRSRPRPSHARKRSAGRSRGRRPVEYIITSPRVMRHLLHRQPGVPPRPEAAAQVVDLLEALLSRAPTPRAAAALAALAVRDRPAATRTARARWRALPSCDSGMCTRVRQLAARRIPSARARRAAARCRRLMSCVTSSVPSPSSAKGGAERAARASIAPDTNATEDQDPVLPVRNATVIAATAPG